MNPLFLFPALNPFVLHLSPLLFSPLSLSLFSLILLSLFVIFNKLFSVQVLLVKKTRKIFKERKKKEISENKNILKLFVKEGIVLLFEKEILKNEILEYCYCKKIL